MPLPLEEIETLIDEFAIVGGVTIERRGPGTRDAMGAVQPAAPTLVVLDPCAVVPMAGRQRTVGDVVHRTGDTIELYARAPIYTDRAGGPADVVRWSGRLWTVQGVEDYGPQGNAWIALAGLQEASP